MFIVGLYKHIVDNGVVYIYDVSNDDVGGVAWHGSQPMVDEPATLLEFLTSPLHVAKKNEVHDVLQNEMHFVLKHVLFEARSFYREYYPFYR